MGAWPISLMSSQHSMNGERYGSGKPPAAWSSWYTRGSSGLLCAMALGPEVKAGAGECGSGILPMEGSHQTHIN